MTSKFVGGNTHHQLCSDKTCQILIFNHNRPCTYTAPIHSLVLSSVVSLKKSSTSIAMLWLDHFIDIPQEYEYIIAYLIWCFILPMIIWYIDPTSLDIQPWLVCISFTPRYKHQIVALLQMYRIRYVYPTVRCLHMTQYPDILPCLYPTIKFISRHCNILLV